MTDEVRCLGMVEIQASKRQTSHRLKMNGWERRNMSIAYRFAVLNYSITIVIDPRFPY